MEPSVTTIIFNFISCLTLSATLTIEKVVKVLKLSHSLQSHGGLQPFELLWHTDNFRAFDKWKQKVLSLFSGKMRALRAPTGGGRFGCGVCPVLIAVSFGREENTPCCKQRCTPRIVAKCIRIQWKQTGCKQWMTLILVELECSFMQRSCSYSEGFVGFGKKIKWETT